MSHGLARTERLPSGGFTLSETLLPIIFLPLGEESDLDSELEGLSFWTFACGWQGVAWRICVRSGIRKSAVHCFSHCEGGGDECMREGEDTKEVL